MGDAIHVESGQIALFDHIEPQGPMWSGEGPRSISSEVRFSCSFSDPPGVHLSISLIDAAHEQNLRLRLVASDISAGGFTLEAHTWGDTRIGRLSVSWLAIGRAPETSTDSDTWDV